MSVLASLELREHGHGGQLYLKKDFATQFGFPLETGREVLVQLLPHQAVVLLPLDDPLEYPLTVPHPQRIDPKTDLGGLPIEPLDEEPPTTELHDFEPGGPHGA